MKDVLSAFPVLIIHYTPLRERKAFLIEKFEALGIRNYQFLEKFDREVITPEMRAAYYLPSYDRWMSKYFLVRQILLENIHYSPDKKSWGENLPQGIAIDPNPRLLNDSEVAVTIAHIEAYKMIIENGWNYAMVIEDDAVFLDGFAETFCRNFCLTPADWDLIFFGNGCGYRVPERTPDQTVYKTLPPRSKCSDSYLISRSAAAAFIESMVPFTQPIDFELGCFLSLFNKNSYWWDPPLAVQGSQVGQFTSSHRG